MGHQRVMQKLAKWHIWFGWLFGVPILIWTISGVVMVARPNDEVRGVDMRREMPEQALPPDTSITVSLPSATTKPVRSVTTLVERGETVTRLTYMDDTTERFRADGSKLSELTDAEARSIVAKGIRGGDRVVDIKRFSADAVPFDFRREVPVWQVSLADGTRVYVGTESGEIEAVRTRWWRFYDFMWGLHIMDLETREDTHHPILITSAILALLGSMLGFILMFRRRRARVAVPAT